MNLRVHFTQTPGDQEPDANQRALLKQVCRLAQAKVDKEGLSPGEALGQAVSMLLYDITEGLFGGESGEDVEELDKFLYAFYDTFNQWKRCYHD